MAMEVLLVIDVQQKYMNQYEPELLDRINTRIKEAVSRDIPVIYVRNIGRPENDEAYTLAEGLEMASEMIFYKRWPSAFSSEDFVSFIKRLGINIFNVVGVDGRCCVYRTVMDAINQGYKVRILLDSVSAMNDKFFIKELPMMEEAGAIIEAE